MKLGELGEFGLIDKVRNEFDVPQGFSGIGDDCASLPQKTGYETLVSTDMLVEDTHFIFDRIPAYCLGWKSAAVNISDIAAMGGHPVSTFLSLALPEKVDYEWISEFFRGYRDISDKYCVALLGGDTTRSSDKVCINVAVTGECPAGKSVRRSAARVGDIICVTGPLGLSAAGLNMILEGNYDIQDKLVRSHYLPHPRIDEGIRLAEMDGIGAMMDISDGIASDLWHILKESGVGAVIDTSRLPMDEDFIAFCSQHGLDPVNLAVSGGEDYELLFTCRKDAVIPVEHIVIGTINDTGSIQWAGSNKEYCGFRHF